MRQRSLKFWLGVVFAADLILSLEGCLPLSLYFFYIIELKQAFILKVSFQGCLVILKSLGWLWWQRTGRDRSFVYNEPHMFYFLYATPFSFDDAKLYRNIQYLLENVSNMYWTKWLYLLIKSQMSNQLDISSSWTKYLFIIRPIVSSS